MADIIELINKELQIIADARARLKEYQSQLTELNSKVKLELGQYIAPKSSTQIPTEHVDIPTETKIIEALKEEALTMGQLVKAVGYGAGQLRKVLAELEARRMVERSGQKRGTKYGVKK
jgi:predicted Rossmann fold nucleotide-binding protein DprA/Smf involved in DNA uptake